MIYVAGPWFTPTAKQRYDELVNIARNRFDIDVNIGCDEGKIGYAYFPREDKTVTPYETFKRNVRQIENCKFMIAIMDEKDCGTSWELGLAYANGKDIYLMGDSKEVFKSKTNLMLAYNGKCVLRKDFGKLLHEDFISCEFFEADKIDWTDKE